MKGNLARQLAMGLATALLLVGCTSAAATPAPSTTPTAASEHPTTPPTAPNATLQPSPTPSASPAPTLSDADSAAVAAAESIIRAVGGAVPLAASSRVLPSDPISGELGTFVEIGGWQVAWNSRSVLRWVFSPDVFAVPPDPSTWLTESQARERVKQALTSLGVSLGAPDSLVDYNSAGWKAQWDRRIDGIRAAGDGTWVSITADGGFAAYGYSESPTAPKPARTITKAQALAKAPYCKNGTENGKTGTCTIDMVWHAPYVEGQKPPLRLCWYLQYSWTDIDEDSGAVGVWLDAGTGEEVDSRATS